MISRILAVLSALLTTAVVGQDDLVLVGRVTRIVDGDTIDVQLDSGPIRVRFDSIDAPERRQQWGPEATEALARRVADREVELAVTEQDRYDRLVSTVYVGGENVNAWLVEQGHAWVYQQYLNDESLLALETDARRARRGLWSRTAVPPWDWRRSERQSEAQFFLRQCGLSGLDGDGDGVPCEAICP